jgi:hypothetical protein
MKIICFQYGLWGKVGETSTGLSQLKSDICQNEYLKMAKDHEYVKAIPQVGATTFSRLTQSEMALLLNKLNCDQ